MELSHTKTTAEVLEYFSVRETEGLSGDEVERQRKKYGPNGEKGAALAVAGHSKLVLIISSVCRQSVRVCLCVRDL